MKIYIYISVCIHTYIESFIYIYPSIYLPIFLPEEIVEIHTRTLKPVVMWHIHFIPCILILFALSMLNMNSYFDFKSKKDE